MGEQLFEFYYRGGEWFPPESFCELLVVLATADGVLDQIDPASQIGEPGGSDDSV